MLTTWRPSTESEGTVLTRRLSSMDDVVAIALDSSPVGLIILNRDRTVCLLTRNAAAMLGVEDGRRSAGMPIRHMLEGCTALQPEMVGQLAGALDHADSEPQALLLTVEAQNGRRMLAADIRTAGRVGWVVSLEDVTQTRQTQDWLLEHVSSDPVTGLWNRQHFMLMLQDSLFEAPADPTSGTACVLLVELNGYENRIEALGAGAGDACLRHVGDRLAALLGETDMLGRFSGDEFALALARPKDLAAISAFCERVHSALSQPCGVDEHMLALHVRIGVALATEHGSTPEELMAHARLALQAADEPGATSFFHLSLTERAQTRRAFEADLRCALDRREFELHYQPQVDVYRGCVTGLEALIRWRSPSRGLVPPIAFIPVAETLGLICEIGDWVLLEACREAITWPDEVTVAVNASPLQFETGHFARSVSLALASSGLPAGRLEIEVTENLLLRDTGTVLATLAALRRMGVRLVLDDFGTGYASLSQLSRFRFDKIKIDRSFISPDDLPEHNSAIVRSIAALGTSLGIPTTAEGVETATQLEQIKADGCTCVQGYFFSRPVPAADVKDMMTRLHRPIRVEDSSRL